MGTALALLTCPAVAAPDAVRILVSRNGIYSVSGRILEQAGVPLGRVDSPKLGLTCGGKAVARRVVCGPDGRFTRESSILFYGEALNTRWTGTNVYRLTWHGGSALDMQRWVPRTPAGPAPSSFPCSLHLEENKEYAYLIWAPDKGELDPWRWLTVRSGQESTISFDLPGLVAGPGAVKLRVRLRGGTAHLQVNPDHHALVSLNGTRIGDARFDNQAALLLTSEVAVARLKEKGNTLAVRVPGDTAAKDLDQVALDWLELDYPRGFRGGAEAFDFTLPQGAAGQARLRLPPQVQAVDLMNITDPAHPLLARGLKPKGRVLAVGYGAGPNRRVLAVPDAKYLTPEGITAARPPHLRRKENGADYLIIAHDSLLEAIKPLAEHRARSGMRVATVAVQDIYDEFSGGVLTPHAIKAFLAYAHKEWQRPAPRYVLLVGDANYDYRDYLGTHVPNLVPAYPVRVQEGVETPADWWYVCLDGPADRKPEMAIGRLPASTPEQVATMVRKTLAYEQQDIAGEWAKRVLVVADHELEYDEPAWFEVAIERLWRSLIPLGYAPEAHYLRLTGISRNRKSEENRERVRSTATPEFLKAWNNGVALVVYEGHGGALYWSRQHVFQSEDVARLTNTILPVLVEVTCFTGQFDRPNLPKAQCLAEVVLTAPGGAVACVSPTRVGGLEIYQGIAQQLMSGEPQRLGPLIAAARERFTPGTGEFWGERDTYNLLGDPALVLRIVPAKKPAPPAAPTAAASPRTAVARPAEEKPAPPGTPKQPIRGTVPGGPPDENRNGIDDRLEELVAARMKAGQPLYKAQIAILLRDDPDEALARSIQGLGGTVEAQAWMPPSILIWLPVRGVQTLAQKLGDNMMFMRWGANPPRMLQDAP